MSLIQIHALLVSVRQELEEVHDVPDDVFAEYDSMGVKPIHIHMNKDPHKQAVFALLTGIREVIWVKQHLQDGQAVPEVGHYPRTDCQRSPLGVPILHIDRPLSCEVDK